MSARDYSTHTERDAGLAARADISGPVDSYEMALERGYDPHEDYSTETSPADLELMARGRRVGLDASNPASSLHEPAVAEAWAILDGSWERRFEALGLMSVGVGSHNLPRREESRLSDAETREGQ